MDTIAAADSYAAYDKKTNNIRWSRVRQQDVFWCGAYPPLSWNLYDYNPALVDITQPPKPEDFFRSVRLLGSGSYGKVELVEVRLTGEQLALKIMCKQRCCKEVRDSELACLIAAGISPYIVRYHSCFETKTHCYILMQYFRGSNLASVIKAHGVFEIEDCRHLMAEMCEGLFHLHRRGVIHRDIKLTNVLLGLDNHIKICDLGLSKLGMTGRRKTNTRCGALRYCAPEVVTRAPYSKEVDWWSLGVLMYQMLVGKYPFDAKKDDKSLIVFRILNEEPDYSPIRDEMALDLLCSFLTKDGRARLGYGDNEELDIKTHPFFMEGIPVDWDRIAAHRAFPPTIHRRSMRRASIQHQIERKLPKEEQGRFFPTAIAVSLAAAGAYVIKSIFAPFYEGP